MLMQPPPSTTPLSGMSPVSQSLQLLGNPTSQSGASQNPQMVSYLAKLAGQGGFGGPGKGISTSGFGFQQGPLGTTPPQPNQGGFR